jgi:hypothetical protein
MTIVANDLAVADERRSAAVRRLDAVAHLMDDAFPVPLFGMRFGLDPVIGLIPGVGDAVGALVSAWIVFEAARLGAGFAVVLRMLVNLGIDALVGSVPVLGDLFDAGWKANDRNLRLLHHAVDAPGAARRSSGLYLALVALLLLALFGGTLALIWWVLSNVISGVRWGV